MAEARKRKSDIVFLNVLFCLLVIYIHTASEVVNYMPKDTLFFKGIYVGQKLASFVVPGFLLLSGIRLFLSKGDKINYGKFYASRIVRVILPYVFWSVIYYIVLCSKSGSSFNIGELCQGMLTGNIWAHFYFVVILVQFEILAPLWMLLFKRGTPSVHIAFSAVITALSALFLPSVLATVFPDMPNIDLSNLFLRYQIYWTAGCLIGRNYNEFIRGIKENKILITIVFLICGFLDGFLSLMTVGIEPVWMELFHMMFAMSAILFFFMVAQAFTGKAEVVLKPLSVIDKSSYMIYLMHCLVILIINDELTKHNIMGVETRFAIRTASVYIIVVGISILWHLVKKATKSILKRS